MLSYTLILSRGTHVISAGVADAILRALDAGAPTVNVDLDVLCDGFIRRNVALVMSHVIALIPNDAADGGEDWPAARPIGTPARNN